MNPPLSIVQLKRLKSVMQSMLMEANNANWQELSRLDSERRVLIGYTVSGKSTPDASASLQSASVNGKRREMQATPLSESAPTRSDRRAENSEYLSLSAELTALDKEINQTVLKARHALLEQTRGLRAQVSAKKGYEQASTMKISSYS